MCVCILPQSLFVCNIIRISVNVLLKCASNHVVHIQFVPDSFAANPSSPHMYICRYFVPWSVSYGRPVIVCISSSYKLLHTYTYGYTPSLPPSTYTPHSSLIFIPTYTPHSLLILTLPTHTPYSLIFTLPTHTPHSLLIFTLPTLTLTLHPHSSPSPHPHHAHPPPSLGSQKPPHVSKKHL